MVEHERRRADAEAQAYRNGFAAGQAQAQQRSGAAHRRTRWRVIADGLAAPRRARSPAIETRLETEAVEVAVAVAAQACAGADRARAVRRDRGARDRMLPPSGRDAARRRARRRPTSTRPPRRSSTRSRAPRGFEGRLVVIAETRRWRRRLPHRMGRRRRHPRSAPRPHAAIDEAVSRYIVGAQRAGAH